MKRKRSRRSKPTLADAGLDNPLEAIPVLAEGVEVRTDKTGRLHVRRRMPPRPGLTAWFARRLKQRYEVRVTLDKIGGYCFEQMDSRRNLSDIAERVGQKFRLDRDPCRQAVVTYIRTLMDRKLVRLKVPPAEQPPETDSQEAGRKSAPKSKGSAREGA